MLLDVLTAVAAADPAVRYVDTHAGEGRYPLAPTGEWTEGVGRLWAQTAAEPGVARYQGLCHRLAEGTDRPHAYPGSPLLAGAALGPRARLVLWERDDTACAALRHAMGTDRRVAIEHGDGLTALAQCEEGGVVFVDPPWTAKGDWVAIPDALVAAVRATRHTCFLLWYPVKSLTRPNAMVKRLERAGVGGVTAELVTTPLEHQRNRLNGSGVVLVRPPAVVVERVASMAPVIGERCSTHDGAWSYRMKQW